MGDAATDETLIAALVEMVFSEFNDRKGLKLDWLDEEIQEDIRQCLSTGFREELQKAHDRATTTEQPQ